VTNVARWRMFPLAFARMVSPATFLAALLYVPTVSAVIGAPVSEPEPSAKEALDTLAESLAASAAQAFTAAKEDYGDFAVSPPLGLADVAMAYLDAIAGGGSEAT